MVFTFLLAAKGIVDVVAKTLVYAFTKPPLKTALEAE